MPNYQNTSNVTTNQFLKGFQKDLDPSKVGPDSWTRARNVVNNSHNGDLGDLGNEPATLSCVTLPYSYIGAIHIIQDSWAVFSTDDINSEIGIFDESDCSYTKVINDLCLGFNKANLITGHSKKNFDCSYSIYWDDALNPSRQLNLARPEYKLKDTVLTGGTCFVDEYTKDVNCEKLRLARIINTPKVSLKKGVGGGVLPNGSYQVAIAYTVNEIRVTDYFTASNVQSLFTHQNLQGSLDITIDDLDTTYDEYELVVISFINQKMNAQKVGNYSTRQQRVSIDLLQASLPVIPLEYIPLQTPAYDKSDAMYQVNNYLLRVGIYTKPGFNYQLLANKITTKWAALELPADYYYKGGNLTSYMRDEVYAFFIRWIYNTGEKSASYHIPGRSSQSSDLALTGGQDAFEVSEGRIPANWEVHNTARTTSFGGYNIQEGRVIAEGDMAYWQSTETYPANQPDIWGDLCGKSILHHKLPDNAVIHNSGNNGSTINILGVKFDNIQHPVDFDGNPIISIIGYEILRGSREGNKSIIAKGLINNVGEYDIPDNITTKKGIYPNYPYNDLRTDPFLSKTRVRGGCGDPQYQEFGSFRKDTFTFHSPDTQFKNPFISADTLSIESEEFGTVTGNFDQVFKHPKHKMIRDFALFSAGVIGVGAGLQAIKGKKVSTTEGPRPFNAGTTGLIVGTSDGFIDSGSSVLFDIPGSTTPGTIQALAADAAIQIPSIAGLTNGGIGSGKGTARESGAMSENTALAVAAGTFLFTYFLGRGTDEAIRAIKSMLPFREFAYQYNSHGFYSDHTDVVADNRRRKILDYSYLEPHLQEFTDDFRVNNLFRSRSVILKINADIVNPSHTDTTRKTIGQNEAWTNPTQTFITDTSAYYAALKNRIDNQYGQIESIIQVPVSQGVFKTNPVITPTFTSPVMFGGDVYINRYSEKNTMFYFNDWMFSQPDGYPFDYNLAYNIPYARYWINTEEYDVSKVVQPLIKTATGGLIGSTIGSLFGDTGELIGGLIGGLVGVGLSLADFNNAVLPNDYAHLDRSSSECNSQISFGINNGYFYLFNNGVRDFFVESEINIAQRDHDDTIASRHYDYKSYTDLKALFQSDIIKAGNNFKYDYSLSQSKLLYNYISWGTVLPRDYSPTLSEKCYSYYPNRVIYSLPQELELKKDNWSAFLANNYKDFPTKITAIKGVHKTGAIIYFDSDSPVMFQGVDQLRTEGGIKVTIGDGGLFNQPLQSIVNSDVMYEYGSSQSRESIIATPQGVFSISQNQGKIFQYGGDFKEISRQGNKWWFAQYLPSKLLADFPEFELADNNIIGVGSVSGYDNTNEVLYFSKRDFQVKDEYKNRITYVVGLNFLVDKITPILLGDLRYFDDASFTVSYDPKNECFISDHDWVPNAMMASKNHLMSVVGNIIYKHNSRCDLFCNFYGIDYPFEIGMPVSTGQEVTTLRSVEYILEAYKYSNSCRDEFHILDENFDEAVISNSEQTSGILNLIIKPKNNPWALNRYPDSSSGASTKILVSKEENKYRFNTFFDLTKNRGEFSDLQVPLWITSPNGYIREVNSKAVNYGKGQLERKRFRHYTQELLLRKIKSGSTKFLLKLVNQKQLKSSR